ncbi:peptidyl-prolyl cis-trans isomerase FKBP65-like protein [Tanacetum coccineum]
MMGGGMRSTVLEIKSKNVKTVYERAQAYINLVHLDLAELDIKKAPEIDSDNRDVKPEYKVLKKKMNAYNKTDAKFYGNMFGNLNRENNGVVGGVMDSLFKYLHLYMCVAILKRYRAKIMGDQISFDNLLQFINLLSGQINLDTVLRDAEALCQHAGENIVAGNKMVGQNVSNGSTSVKGGIERRVRDLKGLHVPVSANAHADNGTRSLLFHFPFGLRCTLLENTTVKHLSEAFKTTLMKREDLFITTKAITNMCRHTKPSTVYSLSFGSSIGLPDILLATSSSGSVHAFLLGSAVDQREIKEEKKGMINKLQIEENKVESLKRDKAATQKLLLEITDKKDVELATNEAKPRADSRANDEARSDCYAGQENATGVSLQVLKEHPQLLEKEQTMLGLVELL